MKHGERNLLVRIMWGWRQHSCVVQLACLDAHKMHARCNMSLLRAAFQEYYDKTTYKWRQSVRVQRSVNQCWSLKLRGALHFWAHYTVHKMYYARVCLHDKPNPSNQCPGFF